MTLLFLAAWFSIFVVRAYVVTPAAVQVRLGGVDLGREEVKLEKSPFERTLAPDSRTAAALGAIEVDESSAIDPSAAKPGIKGGTATIRGVVTESGQPVPAARVSVERQTKSGFEKVVLITNQNGQYLVKSLLGGRYRVRAWVPGEAASAQVQTVFLADHRQGDKLVSTAVTKSEIFAKNLEVDLTVKSSADRRALAAASGGPIYIGSTGQVGVSLSKSSVDAQGVLVDNPEASTPVRAIVTGPAVLKSQAWVATNSAGQATYTLGCLRAGSATVTFRSVTSPVKPTLAKSIKVNCIAPPVPTTTTTIPALTVGTQP